MSVRSTGGVAPLSPSGRGRITHVIIPAPAAGAQLIYTVPAGFLARFAHLAAVLTTNATVGSRVVELIIANEANTEVIAFFAPGTGQPASQVGAYFYTAGATAEVDGLTRQCRCPPTNLWLPPSWRVRTFTNNMQGTDQWSGANLIVELASL